MNKDSVFSPEDTTKEVARLDRPSKIISWRPTGNYDFKITIPPTVYPPREDTDLLARRMVNFGPGKGRNFLEIGCGSGALSLLASSLGWKVSACDINPFAVAASKGNLDSHGLDGQIKEGGVGPEEFPFADKFDLIIWNLPYIPVAEVSDVLGPMEEAALIDTDERGLANRLVDCIHSNQLLATNGKILILGRDDLDIEKNIFAVRKWDEFNFEDGEKLAIRCLWRPFENAVTSYVKRTGSTNDDVMKLSEIGSHVSSSWQDSGRGRRKRKWHSIENSYAGSWIIAEGASINPGLIQLAGGLAFLNSIKDIRLKLKWPNDILYENRKMCGILVEGKSIGKDTKVIVGIGINLKGDENFEDFEIACLDEISDISHDTIDARLNIELSSLLEEKEGIPPVDFEGIKKQVHDLMLDCGKPKFDGKIYQKFELNERGEMVLDGVIVDDGEEVEWV